MNYVVRAPDTGPVIFSIAAELPAWPFPPWALQLPGRTGRPGDDYSSSGGVLRQGRKWATGPPALRWCTINLRLIQLLYVRLGDPLLLRVRVKDHGSVLRSDVGPWRFNCVGSWAASKNTFQQWPVRDFAWVICDLHREHPPSEILGHLFIP